MQADERSRLVKEFGAFFSNGERFDSIAKARHFASDVLGRVLAPGTPDMKAVDECIERGLVHTARDIVQSGENPLETFDRLVELHERQPNLSVRTSTSILQQAYSTPLPIAYLAGVMAGIDPGKTVYEPTAGNGALLLLADPAKTITNEINPERAEALRAQGFNPTEFDATTSRPGRNSVDVVITNPPFGSIRDGNNQPRWFAEGPLRTTQIDHVIALNALKEMKEDGQGVLILGGKLGNDEARSERYNSQLSRGFFRYLYKDAGFKVVDHFSIAGSLYSKQGAGFPIDIILIGGKGTTDRKLPAVELPQQYQSFDELRDVLASYICQSEVTHDGKTVQRVSEGSRLDTTPLLQLETQRGRGNLVDNRVSASTDEADQQHTGISLSPDATAGVSDRASDFGARLGGDHAGNLNLPAGLPEPPIETGQPSPDGSDRADNLGVAQSMLSGTRPSEFSGHSSPPTQSQTKQVDARSHESLRLATNHASGSLQNIMPTQPLQPQTDPHASDTWEEELSGTVPYVPRSKGMSLGVLVPSGAVTALETIFDKIESATGMLVDEYVQDRLQEPSLASLHKHYAAEQVDSLALAIYNHEEKGNATLIGHDTGIGKTRIVCGLAQYAQNQGLTPVILTADPVLFTDIIGRDAVKTETDGVFEKPLFTASNLKLQILDEEGNPARELRTKTNHRETVSKLAAQGDVGDHTCVLSTYSQFQGAASEERRELLRTIAPKSFLILDESHKAGGAAGTQRPKTKAEINAEELGVRTSTVSDFFQEIVKESGGFVASSATAVKDPIVAARLFYDTTDLRHAAQDQEQLAEHLRGGGVPLQQMAFGSWTESGGCIRFEKSYEGVELNRMAVPVDLDAAENNARILNQIWQFDKLKNDAVSDMDDQLSEEGERAQKRNSSIGDAGASSTIFTSVMHNLISVTSTALKVAALADQVIQDIEEGRKPVVTLFNTGESVISGFIESHNEMADEWNLENPNDLMKRIEPGDAVAVDAGELFMRYLEKSRMVKVVEPYLDDNGNQITKHRRLTDDELGGAATAAYEQAKNAIEGSDWSRVPVSPIDYFKQKVEDAGFSIGEITGRSSLLTYDSAHDVETGVLTYEKRETSPLQRRQVMDEFNSGKLDALITNATTGYSIHASRDFDDQRQRVMYVLQPQADVNQVEQNFGRIHRSGQLNPAIHQPDGVDGDGNSLWGKVAGEFGLPKFKLVVGQDLPTEERSAAVLMKKMSHLKANTTGNRDGSLSFQEMPDFINDYGNQVATRLMENDPQLHAQLDHPLGGGEELGNFINPKAIQKVTGRIPMLVASDAPTPENPHPSLARQAGVYEQLTNDYKDLLNQKIALGENDLEAQKLDLKAKPIARMVLNPGDPSVDSPFTKPTYLVEVEAKTGRKPNTTLEVVNAIRFNLGMDSTDELHTSDIQETREQGEAATEEKIEALQSAVKDYLAVQRSNAEESILVSSGKVARCQERLDSQTSIKEELQKELDDATDDNQRKQLEGKLVKQNAQVSKIQEQLKKSQADLEKKEKSLEKNEKTVGKQADFVASTLEEFSVGQPMVAIDKKGDMLYGVVEDIRHTSSSNPAALNSWKLDLRVVDGQRSLTVSLDQLVDKGGKEGQQIVLMPRETAPSMDDPFQSIPVYESFDDRQVEKEEKRYLVTGQILGTDLAGRFAHITDNQGDIHPAYLLSKSFNPQEDLDTKPVLFTSPAQVKEFLFEATEGKGAITSADGKLAIHSINIYGLELVTPKPKPNSVSYSKDTDLINLTGDFTSTTRKGEEVMVAKVDGAKVDEVLDYLSQKTKLGASEQKDVARTMLNLPTPQWEATAVVNPDYVPHLKATHLEEPQPPNSQNTQERYCPTLQEMRDWRDDAKLLERDAHYVKRIIELSGQMLAGTEQASLGKQDRDPNFQNSDFTLSDKAHHAMMRDQEASEELRVPSRRELMDWYRAEKVAGAADEKLTRIMGIGKHQIQGTQQEELDPKERDPNFKNPDIRLDREEFAEMQKALSDRNQGMKRSLQC